jgi:Rps23 Pro-64 3,4-dihydroxylase Tpa1-like proline 4-hydroxylase
LEIGIIEVNQLKALVIDNWFNEEQYKNVLEECLFLCRDEVLLPPDKSGSAKHKDGTLKKKNKAVFLDALYNNSKISHIYTESCSILFNDDFMDHCESIHPFFRHLRRSTQDSMLLSYYEESDYYENHTDQASITTVCWVYQEPKAFKGGDLSLVDSNTKQKFTIECKPNRIVIFPSITEHGVSQIKMDQKDLNQKRGRFTLSHFINM